MTAHDPTPDPDTHVDRDGTERDLADARRRLQQHAWPSVAGVPTERADVVGPDDLAERVTGPMLGRALEHADQPDPLDRLAATITGTEPNPGPLANAGHQAHAVSATTTERVHDAERDIVDLRRRFDQLEARLDTLIDDLFRDTNDPTTIGQLVALRHSVGALIELAGGVDALAGLVPDSDGLNRAQRRRLERQRTKADGQ